MKAGHSSVGVGIRFGTVAVAALLAAAGCADKKADDKPANSTGKGAPAPSKTVATPGKAEPKKKLMAPKDVRPKADEDYIIAEAAHSQAKPNDPVTVNFRRFKVVSAKFDPKKLEGGTATLEIDLASLESGIGKRDGHLKSGDYFDVGKFGKATVTIDQVQRIKDKTYRARANIDLHGIKAKRPITFEVVGTSADSVRIKAEHKLKRADFGIGKGDGDSVAGEVLVKLQLTLRPVG